MSERPRWLTEAARAGTTQGEREEEREAPARRPATRGAAPKGTARTAGARSAGARQAGARQAGTRPGGPGAARGLSPLARLTRLRRKRRPGGGDGTRVRFEQRAAAVRRRPLTVLAVAAGLVVLLAFSVWLVGFSSVLATRTVTVTGLSDAGEQQAVTAAAAVPIGTPLARVDTAGATDRVLRIPTVATVTVSRSWPSTVVVSVQRKVPVLAVKNPQGQLQVVDSSGVPFETVDQLPPGVAQVNASSDAPDPEGIKAALSVLALLPAQLRSTVSGVTVTSADLVTFQLGKVNVVWGGVASGPKKLVVLQALLPTNPGTIDVSAPDTPVTR